MLKIKAKNNIVYEINCSNFDTVYFSESKCFLKSYSGEHKIVKSEKYKTVKHCLEADHNNHNHNNIISHMIPEKKLPNVQRFLVTYVFHIYFTSK